MLANPHKTLMNAICVGENVFVKASAISCSTPPQDKFVIRQDSFFRMLSGVSPPERKFANNEVRE